MERNNLKNKTFPIMITYSPSYLIRFPENKKYSWEDLKKLEKKIKDLKIIKFDENYCRS